MKKTMSREVDLGNEPVRHLLLVLAVPAITSQVVNALYNMVDRMYIGHIPEVGSAALTGVGVCFPIIMIISAFAYLMGMGGAPRASIYMGKKDNDTAEKILGNSFSALVIVSIILTVTVLVFQEPLLYLFGASENTISYAKSYMTIYAIGTIFVQLTLGMNAFISAQGFYPALRLAALPQTGDATLPLRQLALSTLLCTCGNRTPCYASYSFSTSFISAILEVIPIAIYHCNISIVSRGKGKSAVAAAAYRSGEKLTNEWDGMTHDYTRKGGVVHTEIMLPPHAPPSFSDRSTLWNSVELYEKAGNAQQRQIHELQIRNRQCVFNDC